MEGGGAQPAELRSDCPWYAICGDGALKACFCFSSFAIKNTTMDTNKVEGGGGVAILVIKCWPSKRARVALKYDKGGIISCLYSE